MGIAPASHSKDLSLGQILDHRKAAGHIAIQRAIARRHLRLVARGQHNAAKLVAQRHQQGATNAGLNVFFGGVQRQASELARQRGLEGLKFRHYGNLVVAHAHALGHLACILPTYIRRIR